MTSTTLNIITALACEAKPLIDLYRLSKVHSRPFDFYTGIKEDSQSGEQYSVQLLVCGIGTLNMAAACGWLAAQTTDSNSVWLNVGSAGHKKLATGEIARIHRAVDIVSGRSHYPAMTAKWPDLSSALITYQTECNDYPEDALVDMEGSAFFSVAIKFASTECVQSLKVVSDNDQESVERLNATLITQLIEPHANTVDEFATRLLKLLPNGVEQPNELSLIAHLHSTVSQRQQYLEVISKLRSLHQFKPEMIANASTVPQLLKQLQQHLDSVCPTLSEMVD